MTEFPISLGGIPCKEVRRFRIGKLLDSLKTEKGQKGETFLLFKILWIELSLTVVDKQFGTYVEIIY
jgi:hypothetical protein